MAHKRKIHTANFCAAGKIKLKQWPTVIKPFYTTKENYEKRLAEHVEKLSAMQGLLYARNRYALLVIFQAMDAGGKDSAIRHVLSGVDPQGCQVFSFKEPSAEELSHDFLWRASRCLPARGRIGIFNRSYYEEVLVVRVHPKILENEGLPDETRQDKDFWKHRYASINDFEKHLHRNGTKIVKFFLHISKSEQRKRFLSRLDEPEKNWKFNPGDLRERQFWKQYVTAYEDCIEATHSSHAPWHIIPGDDKANARLIISHIIVEELKSLETGSVKPTAARRAELQKMRKLLEKS